MQTAVKISLYSCGLVHHVFTTFYILTQIDFSRGKDQRIMDMYIYNNRYLTSWNMGLQLLYFTLALIHECMMLNKSFLTTRSSRNLYRIRGYLFTSLVAPCTLVVASFFWAFYHVDKNYMVPVGADEIIPSWINHSIHTNILFLPAVEILLPKMYTPTFWNSFLGITLFSTVYDTLFLFTYFDTGKWMYPLYDQLNWFQRIMLLAVMYTTSLICCRLIIAIQSMKTDTCEEIAKRDYKQRVASVTKKLL
ncbi:uncharacterized protein CBL_20610 [Carabus blaptoides fortunei]